MTSGMTDGQRCLLDILQRKLWNNILLYAKLSQEKQEKNESELIRLKERIRRISRRQKRFTLEIINKNGNNSIPKESFFEALGLVTKEALAKLNSKTNERRRRTTANPRFSHEAIQAKRALEPRFKDNKRETTRRPARQHNQAANQANNVSEVAATNHELYVQFENLQKQITSKVSSINDKRESNKRLEKQNELIRKRGIDIISAINMINPHADSSTKLDQSDQPTPPLDLWIDMKCNESLDGLD